MLFAKNFNVIYYNGIISKWNGSWMKWLYRVSLLFQSISSPKFLVNNKYLEIMQHQTSLYIFFIISLASVSSMLLSVKREETVYVRFRVSGNKREWREMKAHCSFLRRWLSLDLKCEINHVVFVTWFTSKMYFLEKN